MAKEGSSLSGAAAGRTIDKVLEEAQSTGEIDLSGRQLRDYPVSEYDLSYTVKADLSRNRLSGLPKEIYTYRDLEHLDCCNNAIRYIPDDIADLHYLVVLDLSQNQLSFLPSALCQLELLEILLVANNKLVSIPEDIGHLKKLMHMDVSRNDIAQLPQQIVEMTSLKILNVRKNNLIELPAGMARLKLQYLDVSCNKISHMPVELYALRSLTSLDLHGNPLIIPPASICAKGVQYVLKYLHDEAFKQKSLNGLKFPYSSSTCSLVGNSDLENRTECLSKGDSGFSLYIQHNGVPGVTPLETTRGANVEKVSVHDSNNNTNNIDDGNSKRTNSVDTPPSRSDHDFDDETEIDRVEAQSKREDKSVADRGLVETARLRLPAARDPVYNGDMSFEQILIEYNRSPRHGWEDSETEKDNDEQADSSYQDDDTLSDKPPEEEEEENQEEREDNDGDGSSIEVETEIIQPRSRNFSMSDGDVSAISDAAPRNGNAKQSMMRSMSVDPYGPPLSTREDQRTNTSAEHEFQRHRDKIAAAQRREAHNARKRVALEKQRSLQLERSSDSTNDDDDDDDVSEEALPSFSDDGSVSEEFFNGSSSMSNFNPMLTVRRQIRHVDERSDLVKQMRKVLQDELKIMLPVNMGPVLMDGILLCQYANRIHPRIVSRILVPSQKTPSLSLTRRQKNVDCFLTACRKLGVQESLLCSPSAILEGCPVEDIALTVQALASCALRQSSV